MHLVESLDHSSHESLDLLLSKSCHSLIDSGVELSIRQELEYDIDGILTLEDGL